MHICVAGRLDDAGRLQVNTVAHINGSGVGQHTPATLSAVRLKYTNTVKARAQQSFSVADGAGGHACVRRAGRGGDQHGQHGWAAAARRATGAQMPVDTDGNLLTLSYILY